MSEPLKKITMILKAKQDIGWLFPYDKLKHFVFIGMLPTMILTKLNIAWWITLIVVLGVAVGVEVYDKLSKKGTAEIMDIVYALIGWGVVILLK